MRGRVAEAAVRSTLTFKLLEFSGSLVSYITQLKVFAHF